MDKGEHRVRFEEWWTSIDPRVRDKMDAETARKAFTAGCREAFEGRRRVYRFQTGKWKISVSALSKAEAKLRAEKAFEKRAEKANAATPKGGWKITPLH